jgi:pimeloyl-ACP methyl ester carboxylesterase
MAASAPARVRTLSLINTTDSLGLTERSAADQEAVLLRMQTDLERGLAAAPPDRAALYAQRVHWGRAEHTALVAAQGSAMIAAFDHRARGARITAPTLIVAGAEDLPVPAFHARRLQAAIARAQLVVVPRGNHYVPLFQPEPLLALVTAHLASVRG